MYKLKLTSVAIAALLTSLLLITCGKRKFGGEDWYHFVLVDSAKVWVARFDAKYQSIEGRRDSTNLKRLTFIDDFKRGRWMMGNMMAKKNVVGFRIYYGLKFDNRIVPILVGLDKEGNDVYWERKIVKSSIGSEAAPGYEEGAMDMSQKAPPPPGGNPDMLISPSVLSERQ